MFYNSAFITKNGEVTSVLWSGEGTEGDLELFLISGFLILWGSNCAMKAPQPMKTANDKTKASSNLFSKSNLHLTNKYLAQNYLSFKKLRP